MQDSQVWCLKEIKIYKYRLSKTCKLYEKHYERNERRFIRTWWNCHKNKKSRLKSSLFHQEP